MCGPIIHLWIGTTEMETQDEWILESSFFLIIFRWFHILYMIYCVVPSIHMSEHHSSSFYFSFAGSRCTQEVVHSPGFWFDLDRATHEMCFQPTPSLLTHPQRKKMKSPTFQMALRSPLLLFTISFTWTQDPGVAQMWIEIASIIRSR